MIKGRYVATIEIDIHVDTTKQKGAHSIDEIRRDIAGGALTRMIQEELQDGTDDMVDVTVTQQYADVYEVDDAAG